MWRRKTPDHDSAPLTAGALESWRTFEQHVRPDFRRTVVFGLIALAALIAGPEVGGVHAATMRNRMIAYGCAAAVGVFGILASRSAAREVHRIAEARAGVVAATPLRLLVLLGGYLIAAFAVSDLVGLELQHLLVGGAITGIILGLAAQPVLGNLFAGLVLLFARPYVPGQRVRVMSGAINGPHYGTIVSAGLLYTMLQTDVGPLNIPNSALLASAVGPSDPDDEPPPGVAAADPAEPPDDGGAAVAGAALTAEVTDQATRRHPES
jgi:small-conductance mechanosensitive channel